MDWMQVAHVASLMLCAAGGAFVMKDGKLPRVFGIVCLSAGAYFIGIITAMGGGA